MIEFIVESRAGLVAAIAAAAQPDHANARANPFMVRVASLPNYAVRFPVGVTTRRASALAASINKMPKGAFK